MEGINLSDLVAAHRAYADARSRAIEAARTQGGNARTATRLQHQALLDHLQTRVRLLTEARTRAMEQYDAEINKYEQKIGELQQMLREGTGAGVVAPTAPAATAEVSPKPGPKKKK
jgi:hypothetical protein